MVFSLGSFESPSKQPIKQDLVRALGLGKWEETVLSVESQSCFLFCMKFQFCKVSIGGQFLRHNNVNILCFRQWDGAQGLTQTR